MSLLISRSFVWEFMSRDVNLWIQSCISCQRSKVQTRIKTRVQTRIKTRVQTRIKTRVQTHIKTPVQTHIKTPVQTHIKTPVQTHIKTPVQTHIKTPVHTHIRSPVRPLPQFCVFFLSVHYHWSFTRWLEAIPLQFITAEDSFRVLLRSKITMFGVSSVIIFDCGAQFTGSIWSSLCKFLGTVNSPTTSFHPQSNGIVERFYRRFPSVLDRPAGSDWFHHLPLVLLELQSVPSEDLLISSSKAVFYSPLVFSWRVPR